MFKIDTSSPVLVTGATGYVAGWLVGTCWSGRRRSAASATRQGLTRLNISMRSPRPRRAKSSISRRMSWKTVLRGHERLFHCFHTASPFTVNVKDPQELVDPAKLGTRNVLVGRRKRLRSNVSCLQVVARRSMATRRYRTNAQRRLYRGYLEYIVFIARQLFLLENGSGRSLENSRSAKSMGFGGGQPILGHGAGSEPQGDIGEF